VCPQQQPLVFEIGQIPSDADEALEVLGYYIAQLAAAAAYTTGIQRLIVGGGVLKAPGLYEAAVAQLPLVTGGPGASHASSLDEPGFLATPGLGDHSGVLGAVVAVLGLLGTLDRPAVSL
jgi:fructokinase